MKGILEIFNLNSERYVCSIVTTVVRGLPSSVNMIVLLFIFSILMKPFKALLESKKPHCFKIFIV